MFKKIIEFFTGKKEPVVQTPAAPYKVEAPVVDQAAVVSAAEGSAVTSPPAAEPPRCGCGRSPTGLCVGLHKLTPEAWAEHADNPVKKVAEKSAKKPAAKKPAATKKPAAKKTTAKKKSDTYIKFSP
jgi:hypothetical protein